MMADWLWAGWEGPARVLLMGVLSYVFLIVLLRSTGKRTLSKMNAFDFIITIASGSTFAAVLLNKRVSYADGIAAFTVLVVMQYGVAWLSSRSQRVESLVKSSPTVLVWRGEPLRESMREARVTHAEVLAACRMAGLARLGEAVAVVLETAGEFSVIRDPAADPTAPDSTLRTTRLIDPAPASRGDEGVGGAHAGSQLGGGGASC